VTPLLLALAPLVVIATFALVFSSSALLLVGLLWATDRLLTAAAPLGRLACRSGAGAVHAVAAAERRVERAVVKEVAEVAASVAGARGAVGPAGDAD